jgi:molybdenum cofactor cytidylyltransferase
MIGAVIAAAGLSSRMGAFKPLLPYAGQTIVESTINKLQAVGVGEIIVVVGHRHEEIEKQFLNKPVHFVYNPYYRQRDMLYSLQCGIKSIREAAAVFLMPVDMPAISLATFSSIVDIWNRKQAPIIVPRQNGRMKHPPFISKSYFSAITSFAGDGGLRAILRNLSADTFFLDVDDDGLNFDVDTMEEYQMLLAKEAHV